MRFATKVVLLQLATVVAVVAVCTAVFVAIGVHQLRAEAEASALNIARTVAEDPDVRRLVATYSADPGTPDGTRLRDGQLQSLAGAVAARTHALFVVITDDHGIRLAHPNPDRLGQEVSTPFADVLAGQEVVDWEQGTLGESARAKVPVWAPGAQDSPPVGEVSVGFEPASVFDDLPSLITAIAIAALAALAIGGTAALVLRRRWERLTLGVQPEELVALVQNQAAVLNGVGDGVIALDTDGIVRVCNDAAERMLGLATPVGRRFSELEVADAINRAIQEGPTGGVVVGDRVLYVDVHPVERGGRALGKILIVRDRTDLVALAERLESVRAMSGAMRVQRHEFANRIHVATGLIDAGRAADARDFLAEQVRRGPVDFAVERIELVEDPFLQAVIGAKALEAAERGVTLRIADETFLHGSLDEVEDVVAVLGNLIDNAIAAAVRGTAAAGVEVSLLGDEGELVIIVSDSGPGITPGVDVFQPIPPGDREPDRVHGLGIGLPLSRELARRRGGDLWVIDPGGEAGGAVVGARLPGVMAPRAAAVEGKDLP